MSRDNVLYLLYTSPQRTAHEKYRNCKKSGVHEKDEQRDPISDE